MTIIFHRYGSICEPDILEALHALQLTVIEESMEITQKVIEPEIRIRTLAESILTYKASFVFSINYFPYISEICERLHIIYICLCVDCPVLELFSISIKNSCNRIFLFDYKQYLLYHPENPACIFHLPLASNVERYDSLLCSASGSPFWNPCDISFVGSLYTEKSPYDRLPLDSFSKGFGDGLIEAQLTLPGCPFMEEAMTEDFIQAVKNSAEHFISIPDGFTSTDAYAVSHYYLGMRVSELTRIRTLSALGENFETHLYTRSNTRPLKHVICHDGVSTHLEMPRIFHSSKINLNLTMYSIQSGLSQRIWDILGCGGFLLTNYQSELSDHFELGHDLDCFESIEELKDKAAYYLSHEDIRNEIALNGYLKVKEHHTYKHRIAELFKAVLSSC